ncbi:hypothetical protein [Hoeflea sp.]|uniref:hypothetical protein n=1 Tax=Hoeflea sp. TaxID=1940281 RepID=UPI003A9150B6
MGRDGAFYVGVIVGALIAIPAAVALFVVATLGFSHVEWETLTAGAFAMLGAAATVYIIQRQISSSREEYYLSRNKRLFAARATLSHALSDINEYSDGLIQWIVNEMTGDPPVLNGEVFSIIREVIEFSENEFVISGLSTIMARIQIIKSRLRPTSSAFDPNARLLDAVELYALSEAFFGFARDGTKAPNELLDRNRILQIAYFKRIEREDFPHFYTLVQHQDYRGELSAGLAK